MTREILFNLYSIQWYGYISNSCIIINRIISINMKCGSPRRWRNNGSILRQTLLILADYTEKWEYD